MQLGTTLRLGQSGPVQLEPDLWDLAVFFVGWSAGWLLLSRTRPLPAVVPIRRPVPIAVVVPARDEADVLADLLEPLVDQLRSGDELVVVDDHSADETAAVAARCGARVVASAPLPPGWLGKPHACWTGANATTAANLVFIDADVRPAPDLLDRLRVTLRADAVVSVQPWHATVRFTEQASVLCNVVALMGSGAFSVLGDRIETTVAFGPVLAVPRATYERVGGHADARIRQMHTEDIGLAQAVGRSQLFTGRPDTTFRMYPLGLRQTVRGWTRSIATGARSTRWWLAVATLAWIWSLAGGWLATPIVYPLSALQVWVLGRRAASIHPATAIAYPIAVAVLIVVFVRSAVAVVLRREVEWKGRRVDAR